EKYDCFYFVADWHALTSDFADTTQLTSYTYENVADWIGAGLDPETSTFFVQSLVPEHAELYLMLSMVVPVPWLERVPTYKEQQPRQHDSPVGQRRRGAQEGDADVHGPQARARRYSRHGGGQSGFRVSRRVQRQHRRGRGSQGALSRGQGRRR